MRIAAHIAEFVAGLAIVVVVLDSAIRTFVLPRGNGVLLTRFIALSVRAVFDLAVRPTKTYEGRDRVMALYGPITLLTFPVVWLLGVGTGYALMFHGTTPSGWRFAIRLSGSALLTLGFAVPDSAGAVALVFTEAAIGLTLVALLIAYLPTIYGAFSRREIMVTQLSVRANTPPVAADLLIRAELAQFTDQLDEYWQHWELWFLELEETHTSLSILPFFRSPNADRSWLTAAGCVLDACAFRLSALDQPFSAFPAVTIRAGFLSLRAIADTFQVPYNVDPNPDDPIAVAKEEFLAECKRMADRGVPMKADLEQAWIDFRGWRVNYDTVLITLAGLIMAPYAPWVSDRSLTRRRHRPPVRGAHARSVRQEIR